MAGMNKAIICGRLGKDPETKKVDSGLIARLSIATSEKIKDKEITTWHTVVVFGNLAELCAKYLHKGSLTLVEGKIQTRSYEPKPGETKYFTEIIASSVQFLDSKKKEVGDKPQNDLEWGE